MIVTSVCSSKLCTQSTVLYGSTTAVATCGQAHTVKLILDFFAIVHREALQHEATETGAGASTASV